MPRPLPSQERINEWAAMYNSGLSVRQISAESNASYGTVHQYVSTHPDVTMRGYDGKPRRSRPTGRTT